MDKFKSDSSSGLEKTCSDAVVKVEQPWHIILFILNVVVSGSGTIISALMDPKGFNVVAMIFGCIQLICWGLILPWIWSIIHGYYIFEKGKELTMAEQIKEKILN